MERLGQRKAAHEKREAADRAELAARLAVDCSAEGDRMRRYLADADRKMDRAINTLLKLRRGQGVGVAVDPAPDDSPEPNPASPIEPDGGGGDGPDGQGQPKDEGGTLTDEGGTLTDEGVAADRLRSSFLRVPSACVELEPSAPAAAEAPADRPLAEVAMPARAAAEPEGHPAPQIEPTTPAGGERIPQNEPSPPTDGDQIPQNEPGQPAVRESLSWTGCGEGRDPAGRDARPTGPGDREEQWGGPLCPPGTGSTPGTDSERIPQNEPSASRRMAAAAIPALVLVLAVLLLARLSAAVAGAVDGSARNTGIPREERSRWPAGPAKVYTDMRRPLEYTHRRPNSKPTSRGNKAPSSDPGSGRPPRFDRVAPRKASIIDA
jgi:hypothetical protein